MKYYFLSFLVLICLISSCNREKHELLSSGLKLHSEFFKDVVVNGNSNEIERRYMSNPYFVKLLDSLSVSRLVINRPVDIYTLNSNSVEDFKDFNLEKEFLQTKFYKDTLDSIKISYNSMQLQLLLNRKLIKVRDEINSFKRPEYKDFVYLPVLNEKTFKSGSEIHFRIYPIINGFTKKDKVFINSIEKSIKLQFENEYLFSKKVSTKEINDYYNFKIHTFLSFPYEPLKEYTFPIESL